MVCCLLAAWVLGMIFRGVRWVGRATASLFRGGARRTPEPEITVPRPVYEVSPALLGAPPAEGPADARVLQTV